MVVVIHKAVSVAHPIHLPDNFAEKLEKAKPVLVIKEYRLLAVSPGRNVVDGLRCYISIAPHAVNIISITSKTQEGPPHSAKKVERKVESD
jgi:hypothetical protein